MAIIDHWTENSIVCAPEGTGQAVANNVNVYTAINTAVSGNVLTNDTKCPTGQTTRVVLTGTTSNVTVGSFNTSTGAFTATPATNFTGEGSNAAFFTYYIQCDKNDGNGFITQDSATVYVNVKPTPPVAVVTSFAYTSSSSTINLGITGSNGWYYRVKVDNGNNGSIDFTSGAIPNTNTASPLTSVSAVDTVANGDKIIFEASNDNTFASVASKEWVIPNSTGSALTSTTNLAAVGYTLNGAFDTNTTQRNFRVVVKNAATDTAIGNFTVTGTNANPSGTFDASAMGATAATRLKLEITPYDEIGEAVTPENVVQQLNIQTDPLTISTANTIPNLTKVPYGTGHVALMVNGRTYFSIGSPVGFTISGQAITWAQPSGIQVPVGATVIAKYPTLQT